jgi:hypothetical protein
MPAGAVYVGRPTWLGNPFIVGRVIDRVAFSPVDGGETVISECAVRDVEHAVAVYRLWLDGTPTLVDEIDPPTEAEIRSNLRGRDLVCWCPLDRGCHADVLLEIANREANA